MRQETEDVRLEIEDMRQETEDVVQRHETGEDMTQGDRGQEM